MKINPRVRFEFAALILLSVFEFNLNAVRAAQSIGPKVEAVTQACEVLKA